MRRIILTTLCIAWCGSLAPTTANASGPVHLWSQRFGDVVALDYIQGIDVDAAGNIYVMGEFDGTLNLGGYDLVSAGGYDIFLAKFNAAGDHRWSSKFGDGACQGASAIAMDPSENVFITGSYSGTMNFGGGNLTSLGSDIYLAKFSSIGGSWWSRRYGDAATQSPTSLAVNAAGDVYLTGSHFGTVNFGGGNLTSAGINDVFLAKFNFSGFYLWAFQYGDASSQQGDRLALDASGNVYIAASFQGTINMGGGNLTNPEFGAPDVCLARMTPAGAHTWSQQIGNSTGTTFPYDLATDDVGGLYLTGGHDYGTIVSGGCSVSNASDPFVARFSLDGACSGMCGFGEGGQNMFVNADGNGRLRLAGTFRGWVDFGGETWYTPTPTSNYDIFLVTLSASPSEPDITSITDTRNDQGRRVKVAFGASAADDPINTDPVTEYQVYLRNDALPTTTARADGPLAAPPGSWMLAGSTPAHAEDDYLTMATTLSDSTIADGMHWSVYFVRAATSRPAVFYDSEVDSGYSVDNLAPGVPTGFAYSAGVLTWKESKAADFDYFTVYGSNDESFGSAVVVDYAVGTTLDVSLAGYVHYWVTATDFSGNEGLPAHLNTLSGVGGTPEQYVLSIASFPNPFNPSTTVRYTLPENGHVDVAVFDPRGVRVATLVDQVKTRGAHTQPWDGRNAAGEAVGSGVYFAQIRHASGTRSYKMVLLK